MLLVWMRMKADRFMPFRSISTKYTATSAAVSISARRGTSPAAAPFAKNRGRSPSRPSAAPSFANAGRYAFMTPRQTIAVTIATSVDPMPGTVVSTRSSSGTTPAPAWSPSTPTVTTWRAR